VGVSVGVGDGVGVRVAVGVEHRTVSVVMSWTGMPSREMAVAVLVMGVPSASPKLRTTEKPMLWVPDGPITACHRTTPFANVDPPVLLPRTKVVPVGIGSITVTNVPGRERTVSV
jgi:hypothetical protein